MYNTTLLLGIMLGMIMVYNTLKGLGVDEGNVLLDRML